MAADQEIVEILQRAAETVATANLPQELQAAAFAKAVDLMAATSAPGASGRGKGSAQGDPADPIQRVAAKLGVDAELLDEIFQFDGEEVSLTIAPSKLATYKSQGAKEIALLLSAARQGAELETWTEIDTIRSVAVDFAKYDSPNFATSISELGDYFSFSGTRQGRRLKLRRAGYEETAALIRRLYGES